MCKEMTTYDIWNLIIQGAVGLITFLVVILAIFGDYFRSKLSGPKLKHFLNPMGELMKLSDGPPASVYHLSVINDRK